MGSWCYDLEDMLASSEMELLQASSDLVISVAKTSFKPQAVWVVTLLGLLKFFPSSKK